MMTYESYLTRQEELCTAELSALWNSSSWRDWETLADILDFDPRKASSAIELLEAERRELAWRSDLADAWPVDAKRDPFHWRAKVADHSRGICRFLEIRIPKDYPRRVPSVWELESDGSRARQLRIINEGSNEASWTDENTLSDVFDSALRAISENWFIEAAERPTLSTLATFNTQRLFQLRFNNGAQVILGNGLQVLGFVLAPTTESCPLGSIPIAPHVSDAMPCMDDAAELCRTLARKVTSLHSITAVSMRRHGGGDSEGRFLVAKFPSTASREVVLKGIQGAESFQLGGANRLSDFYGLIPQTSMHGDPHSPCEICGTVVGESTSYRPLTSCGHLYCAGKLDDSCLLMMIRSSQTFPVRCVAQGCKQTLSLSDIDAALLPAFDSAIELDAFLEPIVGRAVAKFLQANMDGYRECHGEGCNSIIQIDEAGPATAKTCTACRSNYCSQCGLSVHVGLDCAIYYQRHVKPKEDFCYFSNKSGHFFYCPSQACGAGPMERISGCDHVKCRQCGMDFCCVCGAFPTKASQCRGRNMAH